MMKYIIRTVIICPVLFVLIAAVSGCGGESRPADLPSLYPCSITITLDGKPLDNAAVNLNSVEQSKWFAFGITDQNGVVTMNTQTKYPGVASGEYTVTVTKEAGDPNWTPDPAKPEVGAPVILFVGVKYANKDTSPLHCTVKEGSNQFEFSVEKP
jgi:hypothetical protein